MKDDILYNFISPVTGRVLSDTNYVLFGNNQGIAIPSPIVMDIRLDLMTLMQDFSVLSSASFIIGFPNEKIPNAQVLSNKSNGFLFNTKGLISTFSIIPIESLPPLTSGNIWIGDDTNRPAPSPTITINNLPNLNQGKVWIGNGSNRPVEGTPPAGPPGPRGPAGADGEDGEDAEGSSSLASSGFGSAISSAVKFGLEKLFGGALGTASSLLFSGIGLVVPAGGLVMDVLTANSVQNAEDQYMDYRIRSITNSLVGTRGAEGLSGMKTTILYSNISVQGGRIENIAPSPEADYDAVNAKWVWDLLNDNVEIVWENH